MLRFTILAAVVVFASGAPQSNFIFKNDITPEEAQGYLKQLPFNEPQLSGRTAVLPLVRFDSPAFRSAEAGPTLGHYWKNGKEIENTEDYVEEVYNAAQYHGQDGLGAYAYGYLTPQSSKVENREGSGVVTGSYVYQVPGQKDLIKVRYYADSEGFHQEDNIPKVELKPAEETPELLAARLAFEKAWNEAAAANSKAPSAEELNNFQQYGNYQGQASTPQRVSAPAPQEYHPQYVGQASEPHRVVVSAPAPQEYHPQYVGQASEPHRVVVSAPAPQEYHPQYVGQASEPEGVLVSAPAPEENQARDGKALAFAQAQSYQGNQQQQQQYAQQKYGGQQQQQQQQVGPDGKYEEPEPTGPPHGFFYSFNYPVSIIVPKNEQNAGYPVDHDTVGVSSQ